MSKIKKFFGFEEPKQTFIDEIQNYLPSLSYKQRLIGFIITFGIAILIIVLSFIGIALIFFSTALFAVFYTIGNILLIISTGFLIGFFKQIKNMFKKKRIIPSILFIFCVFMIFINVFNSDNKLLLLIFIIIQLLTFIWYALTYIPYATTVAKSLCCSSMV